MGETENKLTSRDDSVHGSAQLPMLRGYLVWTVAAHLGWEIVQPSLYTIRAEETPAYIALAGSLLTCLRLAGWRLREENHEVHRVSFVQRHADFGIVLESANSGPVPGARVDDHDWRFVLIDAVLPAFLTDRRDA